MQHIGVDDSSRNPLRTHIMDITPKNKVVPKVYSLSICAELEVVKLVHRAAVTIENDDENENELLDGDNYGLAGKIRIHSEGKEYSSLVNKIDAIKNYLEENLISVLIQNILNCSFYIFARPRFDSDYDCLRGEALHGSKEWKDYHIYGYHDLQAIQIALSGKDRMANMYSR